MRNLESGVSVIITFLVMTILLAVTISISVILFSQVKILSSMGDSVVALYVAEKGAEETLYFDRKQGPNGSNRGYCNICNACSAAGCSECTVVSLAEDGSNGCDVLTCANCEVKYTTVFGDKKYEIRSRVIPWLSGNFAFFLVSEGYWRNASRSIEVNFISNQ